MSGLIDQRLLPSGFKAIIISMNSRCIREEWLGFTLDRETAAEFLSKAGNIDPLGESREYQTFSHRLPLYRSGYP